MKRIEYDYSSRVKIITIIEFRKNYYSVTTAIHLLAVETLYNGKYELPPVDKETFIQLCRLSLTNVIMLTTDGIYVQGEGLAMGSPASPLLANLWLNQFESVFKVRDLKFFRRYVDDIVCVLKKRAGIDTTRDKCFSQ